MGPVDYFVDRSGRGFRQGTVQVARKYSESKDMETWQLAVDFSGSTLDGEAEEVLGETSMKCPFEHENAENCIIMETTQRWVCRCYLEGRAKKGPELPKEVNRRPMETGEAAAFFGPEGQTPLLDDFISRFDRPFRAMLVRRPRSGKHKFEFPPREEKEGKKTAASEGEASSEETPAKREVDQDLTVVQQGKSEVHVIT